MREFCILALAGILALPALGQRRGGFGPGGGRGMGGGVRAGGGFRGGGGFYHGRPIFQGGFQRQFSRPWGFGGYRTSYWPPMYGGFYGGLGYGYGYGYVSGFSAPFGYTSYGSPWDTGYPVYVSQPAPPASPVVIVINEPPPAPLREPRYVVRSEPPPDTEVHREAYRPVTYDIRFKDGREITALAFWIQDGTLRYVTRDFVRHSAPLSAVDRGR